MGLAPTLGNSPGQGDLLQSPSPARSLLNATFPHALASGGFGAGLLPVHSPLLRESLKKPPRGPPHQRAPVFDIPPQKLPFNKIRNVALGDGSRSPLPARICGGRKQKGKKATTSRVGHATGVQLHPPSPMLHHNCTISPRKIFRMERHGTGAPTRRELRREGTADYNRVHPEP
ncbi:hypothetical protein JTE90_008921 [Oedothorax gibbosus]|uniref:Uncharacterized protein n=1 Tax=Oedothorax gibbosus TaxID=931172 RepID=A0AAV6TGD2_9ARAC|nr:hypothetical protein JTE90_008921 [Oedothorax gibbosus]